MNLINSEESAQNFLETVSYDLSNAPADEKFLTVDTEFIREGLKIPLLCLVQIATHDHVFVIDPLALDISFLKSLFENSDVKKVFHSARQDLEILLTRDISVENFFDTQLYEMILDTENNISYREIVYRYLGKKIKKQFSLSDWKKRPLSQKQMMYCQDDVTHLREVYKKQRQKLEELGRIDWLDDELIRLKNATNDEEKSALNDQQREIFQKLIELREKIAKNSGVDLISLATNDLLTSICKKGADYVAKLKNSRNKKSKNLKEFFVAAEKLMKNHIVTEEIPSNHLARDLLKVLVEICAEENCIAPSIIATTSELEALAQGETDLRCVSGWRKKIFGEKALELLAGNIIICIKNSEVVAEKRSEK